MKISVIIPVYNVEKYLPECLESVDNARTNFPDIEVIIVNDGSTDRSGEIAEKYASLHDDTHLICQSNKGLSEARNTGIRFASGQYLYFLDSDDTVVSDVFTRLWHHISLHPQVNMVYGQTISDNNDKEKDYYYSLRRVGALSFDDRPGGVRRVHALAPVIAANRLIDRKWLLKHNLFFTPGLIHEDLDWQLRAYSHIQSYAAEKGNPTYIHRMRPGSITDCQSETRKLITVYNIFIETIPHIDILDAPIMRFITDMTIYYRSSYKKLRKSALRNNHSDSQTSCENNLFKQIVTAVNTHPSATLKHRLLTTIWRAYPSRIPKKPLLWLIF